MPGYALEALRTGSRALRENFPGLRNKLADMLLQPGGKGTHQSAKDYFHREMNKVATKRLAEKLGNPHLAAGIVDTAYKGNELVTGGLASLAGEKFASPYGYNEADIKLNRVGQDQAVREVLAEQAAKAERARDIASQAGQWWTRLRSGR